MVDAQAANPKVALPAALSEPSQPSSSSRSTYLSNWLTDGPMDSSYTPSYAIQRPVSSTPREAGPLSRVAFGVNVGTLGPGVEIGVRLANRLNLRAAGNYFDYSTNITQSGITYEATVTVRSVQTSVDWFPFRNSFHISPGAMLYNGNKGKANVVFPQGQTLTVNDTDYLSDPANPLHGSASITFPNAGPQLTAGFGNMISRREGKHFSAPFDVGFVYFGEGTALLNFAGSACSTHDGTLYCEDTSGYPEFQQNVLAEQNNIQNDLDYARFYPIVRMGLNYKF